MALAKGNSIPQISGMTLMPSRRGLIPAFIAMDVMRALAARMTSIAIKAGISPRREGIRVIPEICGIELPLARAIRYDGSQLRLGSLGDTNNDGYGPPYRHVGQFARRLVLERDSADAARTLRRARRPHGLRPGAGAVLQPGFRGREAAARRQADARRYRGGGRARAVRARVQPFDPGGVEERDRLGLAPGLRLGAGL